MPLIIRDFVFIGTLKKAAMNEWMNEYFHGMKHSYRWYIDVDDDVICDDTNDTYNVRIPISVCAINENNGTTRWMTEWMKLKCQCIKRQPLLIVVSAVVLMCILVPPKTSWLLVGLDCVRMIIIIIIKLDVVVFFLCIPLHLGRAYCIRKNLVPFSRTTNPSHVGIEAISIIAYRLIFDKTMYKSVTLIASYDVHMLDRRHSQRSKRIQ